MADIEKRLDAIEKRLMVDIEQWQKMQAQIKGLRLVVEAIAIAALGTSKTPVKTAIKNLAAYERASRMQNEHEALIREIRSAREFFQAGGGRHPPRPSLPGAPLLPEK